MPLCRSTFTTTCLIAAAAQATFLAPAWAGNPRFHQDHVLGTSLDLEVVAPTREMVEAVHQAVLDEVERLRKILSTYDGATDASRLNAAAVGESVQVAPELIEVLQQYEQWRQQSGGAYNPGIGNLVRLWKEGEQGNAPPWDAVLEGEVAALRQPAIVIDGAAQRVKRTGERALNIDSLGKGYIVSRAVAAARAKVAAVRGILLNIGGDMQVFGYSMIDRRVKWPVSVADPARPQENADPLVRLSLSDMAIATSGGYARGYEIEGTQYSHILDPRTGRPVDIDGAGKVRKRAVTAATVVAADCATANALATALCVLAPDEGLALVRKTSGAECFLVLANGSHMRSEGFRKYEVPRMDVLEQSSVADDEGPRWPTGYGVDIALKIKPVEGRSTERPYVAVWIEDEQQQYLTTLAVWGNDAKWLKEMPGWWKIGRTDARRVSSVTRATRPAGEYRVVWNGKDEQGRLVPQGTYRVYVETDYDHGGRAYHTGTIHCGGEGTTATIEASDTFDTVGLTYGPSSTAAH